MQKSLRKKKKTDINATFSTRSPACWMIKVENSRCYPYENVLLLDNTYSSIIYTKDWEIVYFRHHKIPFDAQVPNISGCSNTHLITTPPYTKLP